MNPEFIFALYVFCMHYHSGQWSRLYRLMCRCKVSNLSSLAEQAISEGTGRASEEWEESHMYYLQLVELYADDRK